MRYCRRDFLRTMGQGALALTIPGVLSAQPPQSRQPNILFIAVDDLRPQLGCYGHRQMISPNIDKLAPEGVLFNPAFCQTPVCGSSRASLLSGIRATRDRSFKGYLHHADRDWGAPLSLPKHFRRHGYYTISNGKVYHHRDDGAGGWSERAWRPKGEWGGRGYLLAENQKIARTNERGLGPAYECADVADSAYADGTTADKAISDLRRLKRMDKPFFLATGFVKPHLPFNAPKKYWDLYERDKIDLADNPYRPKDAPDAAIHNWGELRAYHAIPKQGPLSEEMARTLIHGYYACTSYTDAQIGRVLNELDRLGLSDNTIVVLWGDHGWNLGEHTLWCKHCHFQTSLRAPLIVRTPGLKGGIKTDGLTEFVDIYPSLCELAGLSIPKHTEGRSFVPLMKDPNRSWKDAVYSRFHAGDSVRTDRYCYTEWIGRDGERVARMLYDQQLDPDENVNISEKPENAELVQKLATRLHQFRAGYVY
ncbi:MAG: sulfatase [Phycisphaerales bacterium]|nr:MAG: sulfatase [Phycisphaerales bacterium]